MQVLMELPFDLSRTLLEVLLLALLILALSLEVFLISTNQWLLRQFRKLRRALNRAILDQFLFCQSYKKF